VDGKSETAALVVKMDPRVKMSAADLAVQHKAQVEMAASLDALSKADLAAHSLGQQLSKPENSAIASQLAPFQQQLKSLLQGTEHAAGAEKKAPGIDEVTGEASQVYGGLQQADALPTDAQMKAVEEVEHEGAEVLSGWEAFKQKQIPALNLLLRNAHLPAVNLSLVPDDMPDSGDED
jgi:hypothetical protein